MRFESTEFVRSYGTSAQLEVSSGPEIAFAGRSNVGKSSLLNKLCGRKSLARVSSKPGKTVCINFFHLESIYLVDLPGYGYAKVSRDEKKRWSDLMEHYFQSGRNLRLAVQLIDMRHAPSRDDETMLAFYRDMKIPFIVALTKSDKLNRGEYRKMLDELTAQLAAYGPAGVIPFSAVTGEGVPELRAVIENVVLK